MNARLTDLTSEAADWELAFVADGGFGAGLSFVNRGFIIKSERIGVLGALQVVGVGALAGVRLGSILKKTIEIISRSKDEKKRITSPKQPQFFALDCNRNFSLNELHYAHFYMSSLDAGVTSIAGILIRASNSKGGLFRTRNPIPVPESALPSLSLESSLVLVTEQSLF